MEIAEEIRKMVEEQLNDPAKFVVDVLISLRGTQKVLVTIDGDHGVTIDDCASLSRDLGKILDDSNLLKDSYVLEVSTPGVDQPLKLKRQYVKNIGRKLKVKLKESIAEGTLTAVAEEGITISREIGTGKKKEINAVEIPFSEIDKSFVLVSFK